MSDSDPAAKRQQLDKLLAAFRTGRASASDAATLSRPEIPRRLYHYTTVHGLRGIVESSTLWASDARFMNDSSELRYAAELIGETVAETLATVEDEGLKAVLPQRPGFANAFKYGSRPFLACFCENRDLLSQWRGYGAGDSTFSLGLDLSILAQIGDLPANTYLRRVIYNPDEQRAAVRLATEVWIAIAAELLAADHALQPDDLFPYPAIWSLQEALAEHHLCFKHPTFAEEREWRLIKLVNVREELRFLEDRRREEYLAATYERLDELGLDMPLRSPPTAWAEARAEGIDIHFRSARLGLAPYVELPLRDRAGIFTGRIPIWEVTQGPTPDPELSLESLRMYLESQGFGFHTKVMPSGVPLRT